VLAFARLMREEKVHKYSLYSPTLFVQELKMAYPEFADNKQQDSQEFLVYLLNAIDEDTKQYDYDARSTSPVSDLYKGRGVDILTCHVCKSEVRYQEEFFTLSLEIPGQDQLTRVARQSRELLNSADLERNLELQSSIWNRVKGIFSSSAGTVVTIYDCLMSCTVPEVLKGAESRFCEKCSGLVQSDKQFLITTPPNSLILHLKRFKYSFFGSKVTTYIQYPLELQLGPFTVSKIEANYELCAVVVHSGITISRGHYTTYRKVEGSWVLFDDGSIKEVNIDEVLNQEAYLLFYRLPVEKRALFSPPDFSVTCYLLKYWRIKYQTLANPGPLAIRHVLCPHGGLSLANDRSQFEKVSISFWEAMRERYGGDAEPLKDLEDCDICKGRADRIALRTCAEGKLLDQLSKLKRGGPWFIIPKKWQLQWKRFILTLRVVPEQVQVPGPVDTAELMGGNGAPRAGLVASRDYTVISQVLWEALELLYGCGQPVRRVKPDIYGSEPSAASDAAASLTPEQRASLQVLKDIDLS